MNFKIFNYLLQKDASEMASKLGLKLKKVTETDAGGGESTVISCGFPTSGLDKYIGKLVRMGQNVTLFAGGEIAERVQVKKES